MATEPTVDQRVGIELRSLYLMLGDLLEIAEEWDQIGDGERVGWIADWGQIMGGMRVVLDPCYRSGGMTAEQSACYRELLGRLREALPTLRQLNLDLPAVSLQP